MKSYQPDDIKHLAEFMRRYLQAYPDAKLLSPEFYTYQPSMKEGKNAFCIMDAAGKMTGFAPMVPVISPDENTGSGEQAIWTIILALPETRMAAEARSLLLDAVTARAREIKAEHQLDRLRLASDMMVSQTGDIDFLLQNGFTPSDTIHVMRRDLKKEIPDIPASAGITIRTTRLSAPEEQRDYLAVYNTCFPHSPKTLETLQFLLNSPLWEDGTVFEAVSSAGPVGSILLYWNDQKTAGMMDDVMVLPAWRGRGIAKALVAEGLRYFRGYGVTAVQLEVLSSNAPAVATYTALGFHEINQEVILEKFL